MPWYAWLILIVAIGSIVGGLMMLRDTANKVERPMSNASALLSATRKRTPRTRRTADWITRSNSPALHTMAGLLFPQRHYFSQAALAICRPCRPL